MIKVLENKELLVKAFDSFPVFHLFIKDARDHGNYDLYVDDIKNPKTYLMKVEPAVILHGDIPDDQDVIIDEVICKSCWIISPNEDWDNYLTHHFGEHIKSFPRMQFDESNLKIEELRKNIQPLPDSLIIVPINESHLKEGMIKEQITDKFFNYRDFMTYGFGFALLNQKGVIHGFALTNYPVLDQDEIEVSYRVGYDDFQTYRRRGIGTTLVCTFLVEAIKRGYKPLWDAANEISCHIAKKLGYVEKKKWTMFHRIN